MSATRSRDAFFLYIIYTHISSYFGTIRESPVIPFLLMYCNEMYNAIASETNFSLSVAGSVSGVSRLFWHAIYSSTHWRNINFRPNGAKVFRLLGGGLYCCRENLTARLIYCSARNIAIAMFCGYHTTFNFSFAQVSLSDIFCNLLCLKN